MRTLPLALLLLAGPAVAGELAGVTLPDTATVGGQGLVLNGMGLREKYYIDVYVGGLYLPAKTRSGTDAIAGDVPKRIVLHFVYSSLTKDQIAASFREGFEKIPGASALPLDDLVAMLEDVVAGEELVLDYVPGTGTTLTLKGQARGTIPGREFMEAVWAVFVGKYPPTEKLKTGLLGG